MGKKRERVVMKIAVTSYEGEIAGKVDRSFGRAKWFVVVDTENGTVEAHSNRQNVNAAQGAGIQAAQNISNLGVYVVLTGNVGPNAFRTLNAASIKIFVIGKDVETAEEAIAEWKAERLQKVGEATIEGYWV
jgi:predicted Fe-Mo cluster-binding NifX family protein